MKIGVIFKCKLHHISWIVDCFVLVENIESFKVFAFFVANNCLLGLVVVMSSAESHRLSVSTLTFHKYFRFTGEGLALLFGVAELRAQMFAVCPLLPAYLATRMALMRLLACPLMALQLTFMRTWQD